MADLAGHLWSLQPLPGELHTSLGEGRQEREVASLRVDQVSPFTHLQLAFPVS